MRKIVFVLIILSFISCDRIVKTLNGEKSPQIENTDSLKEFVEKNEMLIDLDKNLFLRDVKAYKKLMNSGLCYVDKDLLIIAYGVILFDRNWDGVNYQDAQACLVDELKADSLLSKNHRIVEASNNLSEFSEVFVDKNGRLSFPFIMNNQPVAIVLWAKYKGEMWGKETNTIIRELENSKENYDIYFLNLDPNERFSQF